MRTSDGHRVADAEDQHSTPFLELRHVLNEGGCELMNQVGALSKCARAEVGSPGEWESAPLGQQKQSARACANENERKRNKRERKRERGSGVGKSAVHWARHTCPGSQCDLIAANVYEKYSVGPSIRSIYTRCCFTMTDTIQVCSNSHQARVFIINTRPDAVHWAHHTFPGVSQLGLRNHG